MILAIDQSRLFSPRFRTDDRSILNFTIMTLTGKYIADSQTGFRAFKRALLRQVNLVSNGYEIEAEITVKSVRNGFKLQEVPISCTRRKNGKSKLKIAFDGLRMFRTILKSSIMPICHCPRAHLSTDDRTATGNLRLSIQD